MRPSSSHTFRALPYHAVLLIPYLFVLAWYFNHEPDTGTFLGMFRAPRFAGEPMLADNSTALSFMVFGTALALERPTEYLRRADPMSAIRMGHDRRRLLRYGAIVVAYSAAFTLPQLAATFLLVEVDDMGAMLAGACCAWWSLSVALTVTNIGCMAGNRAAGYLVPLLMAAACAGIPDVQRVFLGVVPETQVPCWVPTLALLTCISAATNAALYHHLDII